MKAIQKYQCRAVYSIFCCFLRYSCFKLCCVRYTQLKKTSVNVTCLLSMKNSNAKDMYSTQAMKKKLRKRFPARDVAVSVRPK